MGVVDDCQLYFGTRNFYEVLCLSKNSSEKELKKAFYKLSLKVHPDRVDEDTKANSTKKFQVLSSVYYILSDREKKALYDETGTIYDEDGTLSDGRDWEEYWRLLFPKITFADIEKYMQKYRGSKEETQDLQAYYVRFEGDLNAVSEHMPGYEVAEEPRYKEILRSLVLSRKLPSFPHFSRETSAMSAKRKKKYKDEVQDAEAARKELDLDAGDESLVSAISGRQAVRESNFESLLSTLERKYASKSSRTPKKSKP